MLDFTGAACPTPTPVYGDVAMPFSTTVGSTANVTCKKGYTENGATVQIKCNLFTHDGNFSLWTGKTCEGQCSSACVFLISLN